MSTSTSAPALPTGWQKVRLTEVAQLESGHTPSRSKPSYWNGGVPWISLHDTESLDSKEIVTTNQTVSMEGINNSSARLLPKGTVVFSRTATVGKATVMGCEMATSQDFANYICGPKVHNHYLVHLFRFMAPEWKRLMAGSIHNTVYMPVFEKLEVVLPPRQEQEAIASGIEDFDAPLLAIEALIAKKRDFKQAAMQALVTGTKRLPAWSDAWQSATLGELFSFSGGHSASREQLSEKGYCYLHYGDIHLSSRTHINLDQEFSQLPKLDIALKEVSPKSLLRDGDVVFVDASEDDVGTSKHLVIVNPSERPYISGLHTIVARSKASRLDDLFKRYCFQTQAVKEQFRFFAAGTKVSGISKTSIAKIELKFPASLEEQRSIATVLCALDEEIAALEVCRDKAAALKQALMQQLLTGRIRLI